MRLLIPLILMLFSACATMVSGSKTPAPEWVARDTVGRTQAEIDYVNDKCHAQAWMTPKNYQFFAYRECLEAHGFKFEAAKK